MRFLIFIFLALVLHLACGQYHSSSASAGVNFENISPSHAAGGALAQSQSINRPRQRRMYAMCPPNFQRIGQECFTYPQQHSSWLEAHFFCKDKNARLAEPEKYSDRKLREFLMKYDAESGEKDPIWIGATYDYMNNVWQWSISGRNVTYNAFSKKYYENNPNMDNQCAVYDPQLRYRWSSRTCVDKHRFICQHKMPKVSENNRHKVYHRWNATYPNQYANEVILEVIDHKGKGRYNRRVIAEGSNEEMVVGTRPRNRQNNRRRVHPTSASLPHENDINYQPQPSGHPNDIKQHPRFRTTTLAPIASTNNNEIAAPNTPSTPDNNQAKPSRRRTSIDRKLERQREKERKRLQRKKERQEKMRQEKEERMAKLRLEREQRRKMKEEKQRRAQQQKELEELRQKESDQALERQQREKQQIHQQEIENLRRQKEAEEKKHLEDQEEERRRQAYLKTLKEQEEQERAIKEEKLRLDRERQKEEEQRLREERKILEERKRKEYEERLRLAENERARQLAEEQERKRIQDEENRRRLEEEEKQRQDELKRQLEEEEERLRLKRLEEERIAEEKELARLKEEQRKRAEIQRKREEEIARLEAEQKRIEEEEARIKEELEESERQAKLQHENEIRKAEEEARLREEERKRAEEQEERERQEKLRQAKLIEESRKQQNKENLSTNLKNRLASLPPELRKEFLEKRKQRKREKLLREKMLRQQQADSTNNEA